MSSLLTVIIVKTSRQTVIDCFSIDADYYKMYCMLAQQEIDQLANLHFHYTSVPRYTHMTDKHMSHSMQCRTAYRYCKLAVILKF